MTKFPWAYEPDEIEFRYKGYLCQIKRNPVLGALCGYVDLEQPHPYFGKGYDDIPVDVHGGLTYSDCEDDCWKIGFDCAHYMDYWPFQPDFCGDDAHYWTKDEVKQELFNLVDQLRITEREI